MKTIKLYDSDSHAKSFEAKVISCEKKGELFSLVLDRTLFFPEGGGQAPDTGLIESANISDVQIKDGVIYHYSDKPFEIGETVHGELDYEKRFRRMQNHSGEHIVSGIVNSLFGYDNVGFHMGENDITVDYNGVLSRQDINKIEVLANRAVYQNVDIICEYPPEEILKTLKYRSKLELTEDVRIVTVKGYDVCACCAPHVLKTGEIGIIKLLDSINYKGGIRIHMLCGEDALCDYNDKYENVKSIAAALSAKQSEAFEAFEHFQEETAHLKTEIYTLGKELLTLKKTLIKESDKNICIFENQFNMPQLRELALYGAEKCPGICIALSGSDKNGYIFAAAGKNAGLRDKAKEIGSALGGKAGGSDALIQGSLRAGSEAIEEYFK